MIRKIALIFLAAVSVIAASNVPMYYQLMAPTANAYLDLVGNTSTTNFASAPPASYSPAEELDITADLDASNWNQSSFGRSIATRWGGNNATRQYNFQYASRRLILEMRSGGASTTHTSTEDLPAATGRYIV